MFKRKISIYMKSGNIIFIRAKRCAFKTLTDNSNQRHIEFNNSNALLWSIDLNQVEAVIVKKWFQAWG